MKFETVEIIEIIFVCGIASIQLCFFIHTVIQICLFKKIIPKESSLKIAKAFIPMADLERLSPKEILANVHDYIKAEEDGIKKEEINIIECDAKTNRVFDKIRESVNSYLIRNRTAAADFNLIKDIVERNTNAVEEGINLTIGIPLYLGLMGTMIGIIIGLFSMPDLNISDLGAAASGTKAQDLLLNDGIALLIGGVKIAMIASAFGLLLTIINSGLVFKSSRNSSEAKKNEFYTFVQIELLPLINLGLAATLESLQRNLLKFNDKFSTNLEGLTNIFDSGRKAMLEQKELLDSISESKMAEIVKYNVTVMQQVGRSVKQFEKFNSYLDNVNLFVENSQHIVNKTNELLKRTDNFKVIADNLESNLNQGQELLKFLSAHFYKLEEHKEITSIAVAEVGHSISKIFSELKEQIQSSSEVVKQFAVGEKEFASIVVAEVGRSISEIFNELKEHIQSSSEAVKQCTADEKEFASIVVAEVGHSIFEIVNELKEQIQRLSEAVKQFTVGEKERATAAVAEAGRSISETLNELKEHIQSSSEVVKQFTVDEKESASIAMGEVRHSISKIFNELQEHIQSSSEEIQQFTADEKQRTSQVVTDVGFSIAGTFKELKEHIQSSSEAVKQFTVDEIDVLKTAFSESRTNLDNLEHLATLKEDVSQFKNSSSSQGEQLKQSMNSLNRSMDKAIEVLEQIEKGKLGSKTEAKIEAKAAGTGTFFEKLFKFKK